MMATFNLSKRARRSVERAQIGSAKSNSPDQPSVGGVPEV